MSHEAGTHDFHAVSNRNRLVKICPTALLSNCEVTSSSKKPIEKIVDAHNANLMYKLLTNSVSIDDLSIESFF